MKKTVLLQSKNWDSDIPLDQLLNEAMFAFTSHGHRGNRGKIVTGKYHNGMNCFEFDNDRYGLIIKSESEFNHGTGEWCGYPVDKMELHAMYLLTKFLDEWGAGEFVNPLPTPRNLWNRLMGNHKRFTIYHT